MDNIIQVATIFEIHVDEEAKTFEVFLPNAKGMRFIARDAFNALQKKLQELKGDGYTEVPFVPQP